MSERDEYDFGDDYSDDDFCCPEGYSEDEWCDPEHRLGIEICEFCCPFRRLDAVYEKLKRKRSKKKKRTTVSVSTHNYAKLNTLKRQLEAIVKKTLSHNDVVSILLCVRPLEDQLTDMIIETEAIYPSKTKKEESNHE